MKLFLSALLLVSLWACDDPNPNTVIDINVNLRVSDQNGQDLLNPNNPSHFIEDDIRIYYVQNGVKKEVYNPNYDRKRNFEIDENTSTGTYFMILSVDEGITKKTETTRTLIQWKEGVVDTLDCLITKEKTSRYCDKVIYNSVVKFDANTDPRQVTWGKLYMTRLIDVKKEIN
jgi:hypothetical protein